ncbi:retrotransposable element Tf2 155 kDa protein type 1 [Striga asiatica]|uniref:Retrotransposable element Tf2 155 kDa protein type 1 n=1 Tax=Striga asiatica TaxID=4170 RepID=A0A5A7QF36_STRAF|nr:retrotransposable element Tf2 155 kDa protein type 1 [Striga asiatica]
MEAKDAAADEYDDHDGLLLYRGRVLIPSVGPLKEAIIKHFHDSKFGGHSGVYRTQKPGAEAEGEGRSQFLKADGGGGVDKGRSIGEAEIERIRQCCKCGWSPPRSSRGAGLKNLGPTRPFFGAGRGSPRATGQIDSSSLGSPIKYFPLDSRIISENVWVV